MTALPAAIEHLTRRCTRCRKIKPEGEFYRRNVGSDDRLPYCRDCDNNRRRTPTEARVLRTRARHRATAELIERHRAEFETLLEHHADMVRAEAAELDKNHDRGHVCPRCGAKPLTETELDAAIRYLIDRGTSVPQIVKQLRTSPERVGAVIDGAAS